LRCRLLYIFLFSSRRRHTRSKRDWSSDVCSSDLKGKRYTGTRRQSKKEAELDELEQKRDLLTGNHLEESQKTLDDGFDDYLTLVAPKRLGLSALQSAESYYKKHIQPVFGF